LHLKPARTPRPLSCILLVGVHYPPGQTAEAAKQAPRRRGGWGGFSPPTFWEKMNKPNIKKTQGESGKAKYKLKIC